ncbi:putative mitogen-activated protein kinase kinase kinase YODA isoform X1 [Iris pallida]|uniref:mitogen-activated protein kinase kinase kinase n=1 Tax=Iris pallida TaxID=29817 RepID=A0AAX6FWV3_IRIPA|nr:putative mitogen-activated protein kinase kinase kinase YODA isoform X1 [Iris pallida]
MPAWWSRSSKSKNPNPKLSRSDKNKEEKKRASSFDEAALMRKPTDPSPASGSGPAAFAALGHPLPRPTLTLSLSSTLPSAPPHDGIGLSAAGYASGSGSGSASSVSSSGSDDAPDLGFFRYSDTINVPRGGNLTINSQRQQYVAEDKHHFLVNTVSEHPRCIDLSISPKRDCHLFGTEALPHQRTSTENIFSLRPANSSIELNVLPLPVSPKHPRALGIRTCPGSPTLRQDDLRSPPHPLPLPPSSPSSSSQSRSHRSQWKKGKLLGRGTFGHVYLGFNSENGQMCAIKEVKVISDDSNSRECLKQLNQEITLLSQLSHPNIVQYYGSELVDDTLSVYLEYVSGGSIHKLLQEYGPFREPVIRSYAWQILSGLAYLHGRNTVHRDIKGANILVDPNGEVKLADFGMAKHISAYTSIRSFKGSPYWMAPEVIMNGNGYNLSVDIWSLGCTILEMATSKPPWSQFEGVAAIFKIGNSKDTPDIPDNLSSDGKSFLKLCLQRDPSARPTASQLLNHPFVRDQGMSRATRSNMFRDMLPSASDGSHTMANMEPSSSRSISPLRDRDHVDQFIGFPLTCRNQSDLLSMRMNMSLPVSPCASPLRQFKQSNRSCLPSPSHPAYSAGAINYGPSNCFLYPTRQSNNFDPWPDIPQLKAQTPYGSPRR